MQAPAKCGDLGFAAAIERVRGLRQHPDATLRECFCADAPIFMARAPGRLDVMGGIADYSGSLVLEMPIAEAAFVSVQASSEGGVVVASLPQDGEPPHELPPSRLITGRDYAQRITKRFAEHFVKLRKRAGRRMCSDQSWCCCARQA